MIDDATREYEEMLLDEIRTRIAANVDAIDEFRLSPHGLGRALLDGANTALEDLAVQLELVERRGILVKGEQKKMNSQQVEQGKKDCRDGVPHQAGRGLSYDYGYSVAYAKEQQQ